MSELVVKRSQFLAFVGNVADRQQADAFVKRLRMQHPQANHVCWAYIAGSPDSTERSMSDDGEPSGTAGMPMLKVLQHSGLGDVVVAIVRYFGGTKLGTGGLQRAYSDAVSQVLDGLPTSLKVSRVNMQLEYAYSFDGAISRILARFDVIDIKQRYQSSVLCTFAVAQSDIKGLSSALINATSDNISITAVL